MLCRVCADYLTVYTTTSASDVLIRPRYRMECAWELDTPLYELLSLFILSPKHTRSLLRLQASLLTVFAVILVHAEWMSHALPYMYKTQFQHALDSACMLLLLAA